MQEQLEALRGLLDELHAERRAQKDKEQSERWTRYTSISIVIIAVLTAIAAVLLGAANAAGGYVVTERMLEMFKSSKKEGDK